jgi:TRAP-type C4-dicarboxylate transport system permease small subunit
MFVYNIDADINYGIEHGGKVATYVYVEWALGSLISGIIFLSTSLASVSNNVFDVADKIIYVGAIVTFALVAYYFLYNLRDKLKKEKD